MATSSEPSRSSSSMSVNMVSRAILLKPPQAEENLFSRSRATRFLLMPVMTVSPVSREFLLDSSGEEESGGEGCGVKLLV